MLSNLQIEAICRKNKIKLNGVFSKDELRLIDPRPGNYIINLQSRTAGNGTHWLALVIGQGQAYYQDPFGAPPPIEVTKFVRRRKEVTRFGYNSWIMQDIKSDSCGWYGLALLAVLKAQHGRDLITTANRFVNQFAGNTADENEEILSSLVSKAFAHSEIVKKFLTRRRIPIE